MPVLDEELSSPVELELELESPSLELELVSIVGSIIIVVPLLLSASSVVDEEEGGSPELLESATAVVVAVVVVWVSPVVTSRPVLESDVVEPLVLVTEVTSSPQAVPSISADRAHQWVDRITSFLG